jgi:hypothetical protein
MTSSIPWRGAERKTNVGEISGAMVGVASKFKLRKNPGLPIHRPKVHMISLNYLTTKQRPESGPVDVGADVMVILSHPTSIRST